MGKILKKFDWQTGNWVNQLVFFLIGCGLFLFSEIKGSHRDTLLLYLGATSVLLVAGLINIILFKRTLRYLAALTIIMANVFIFPLAFYSYGQQINIIAGMGLLYVMATFAVSPRFVGICTLASAATFSCYMYQEENVFEKYPVFTEQLNELEGQAIKQGVAPLNFKRGKYYEVKKPMTLRQISALPEVYGSSDYFNTLYKANKGIIHDPFKAVPPGTRLMVPGTAGIPFRVREYTVKREGSLAQIAARKGVYGNSKYANYLFKANKHKLGDKDLTVLAGEKILVPELPKTPYADFARIALAYIAAAGIAYCWRLLIQKMYQIYTQALSKTSTSFKHEVDSIKRELRKTENELTVLKEEAAVAIVEMNRIVNNEPPENVPDENKSA